MKLMRHQIDWLSQPGNIRFIEGDRGAGKTYTLLADWKQFSSDYPEEKGIYCAPHKLYEPAPQNLRVFCVKTLKDAYLLAGYQTARLYIDDSSEMDSQVPAYLLHLCRAPVPGKAICYIVQSPED